MKISQNRQDKIRALLSSTFFQIVEIPDESLRLYDQALIHSTYAKEKRDQGHACQDYERLEFLGDRILNCAVSDFLYHTYTQVSEGFLSEKMKFTQNSTLARIVKTKAPEIQHLIRLGNNQKLTEAILADTFESLIGAIYLDTDQGLSKVQQLVRDSLATEITSFDITENYISDLQIHVQKNLKLPLESLNYLQLSDHVDHHNCHTFVYEVRLQSQSIGKGTGSNSKTAKQSAAKDALNNLNKLKASEF